MTRANDSMKWKVDLFSTGIPLEFEAAKILVSKGFSITADYTYARNDSGLFKDFSVDLKAEASTPFTNENKITADLTLLVECKSRRENIQWLFLPDVNRPGYSPITLGTTLRAVDEFSKYFLPTNATISFDRNGPFCYKFTEIGNGKDESELKHGISQLQYALPRLVTEKILFALSSHPEDLIPFFFCPILLTNAELFILNSKVSFSQLKEISSLSEIAKKVPYLFFYSDFGPDFENHCKKECQSLSDLTNLKLFSDIEEYRKTKGEYNFNLPSGIGYSLSQGRGYCLGNYFTQFVVCSLDNFPFLLDQIKQITSQCVRRRSSKNPNLKLFRRLNKVTEISLDSPNFDQ